MKFYLIDDDRNVLNILKLIIKSRQLGEVCGTAQSGTDGLDDLLTAQPDIIIVDLLMPEIDGISFVKKPAIFFRIVPISCFLRLHPRI